MAAPTSSAIAFKKILANTEPSTHGTKQSFSGHKRNDRFRVLSGSSADQCLFSAANDPEQTFESMA